MIEARISGGSAMTANDRAEPGRPTPVTLLQRRGIEAEVLIPLIRRLERELGVERAHAIAREEIASIARQQGETVARALGQDGIEGFRHVRDSWGGAGGDLEITTIREDGAHLDFNVTRCRFAEMYEQLGARDLGFLLSCNRDFTLSEGYSERLHLERTQTIMQGAPFCDFRYRVDAGGARGVDAVAAVDAVADSREDTAPETSNAAPEGA
jgi:hypothetical protein